MGEKAQRMTDANTGGGTIISVPQSTVYANSKLLSVNGSSVSSHGTGLDTHPVLPTANGSSTVFAGGTAVNRTGDADSCGHTRTGGSSNVNIG
jgi:uncharacterized Zn-binding protein involved in type VI secretion